MYCFPNLRMINFFVRTVSRKYYSIIWDKEQRMYGYLDGQF